MSARNRELLALIPVALLITAGFTAVLLVDNLDVGNVTITYGAYFLAICVAIHILIRIRLPYADPYLFPLVALLVAVGLVILYRIDEKLALEQASVMVIGAIVFAATIIFVRDLGVLERYRYLIAIAGIVLLVLPRVPGISAQVNGAYLGVDIGPIAFQPAELAKICIVIFLASYLREKREVLIIGARRVLGVTLPPLKHLGPLLVVWGAAMFMLVFIRDLGSSLMFFGAFLAVLYVATNRFSFVVIGLAMFAFGAWIITTGPGPLPAAGQVSDRVDIWLDPFAKDAPEGAGQITQSLYAQAEGGLFGQGLGGSLLKLPGPFAPDCHVPFPECGSILPAPHTDFIYAVITGELGLFGACGVILIFALIAARGFKAALTVQDGFSKLLATGLTAVLALQAFVIIGGVIRVIPLTGVTLPFVSFGGSSVVANMILIALLLIVSNDARKPRTNLGGVTGTLPELGPR
jgi:cell division protein FtsW (lipid II flippase)